MNGDVGDEVVTIPEVGYMTQTSCRSRWAVSAHCISCPDPHNVDEHPDRCGTGAFEQVSVWGSEFGAKIFAGCPASKAARAMSTQGGVMCAGDLLRAHLTDGGALQMGAPYRWGCLTDAVAPPWPDLLLVF